MLGTMFGSKTEEVIKTWIQLYDKEFHNLHSVLNIVRVIK